jgi:hypothetical protein
VQGFWWSLGGTADQATAMNLDLWKLQCHESPQVCNDVNGGFGPTTDVTLLGINCASPWDRKATLKYSAGWDGVSCNIKVFDSNGNLIADVDPARYRGSDWDINGVALTTPRLNRSFTVGNNVPLESPRTYTYTISNCATRQKGSSFTTPNCTQ